MVTKAEIQVGVRFRKDGKSMVWEVTEVQEINVGYAACKVLKGKTNKGVRSWWCLCQLCLDHITIDLPFLKQVRW